LIAILDYGSGNLRSALRAFETTGRKVFLTSDPEVAEKSDALVVPGVGAFGSCMQGLKSVNGDEVVKSRAAAGRPTLGICVGMQILFEKGVEHGTFEGIGALKGVVEKMSAPVLPHMGWNNVEITGSTKLFKGVEKESFYFVHSYAVKNSDAATYASTDYFGKFLSAVESGSISATQFHPEKSGAAGLKLINNWVESL
jgi:glutamine amidotransferase